MNDDKLKLPTSPLNVLAALLPIVTAIYIGVGLVRDLSAIDDRPRKPRPPAPLRELPGRPASPPPAPPARCASFDGGHGALATWLRPLHRSPKDAPAPKGEPTSFRVGPGRVVYVLPIGDFSAAQKRVVELAAELLGITFGLPTRVLGEAPIEGALPPEIVRADGGWGEEQILASFLVEEVSRRAFPSDAAALLGLTAKDLWSGDEWVYTLGETRAEEKIAVWSLYRNGDLEGPADERREALRETLTVATREVGRLLGLVHDAPYDCNGSSSVDKLSRNRGPSWFCPECEASLLAATGTDPIWRYEHLVDFYRENDLGEEEWFYERSLFAARHIEGLKPLYEAGRTDPRDRPVCAGPL